jgi:transcriptional regulator with XRE-family HTH domain
VSVPIEADIDAEIGARLAEVRLRCAMTQRQLAKAIGVTLTTVQNWERGRTGLPAKRLAALANALHCQPIDLLMLPERACRETYPRASAAVAGGAAYRRGFAPRTGTRLRAALPTLTGMLASHRVRAPEVGLPLLGGPRRPQRKPRAHTSSHRSEMK